MENITLRTLVYNLENSENSIEEIRYNSYINHSKPKEYQSDQNFMRENFGNKLIEVIELVTQKINFNKNAYGAYQGTPISTINGNEFIRNCLSISELENLSLEEFRFLCFVDPSKLNNCKDLSQLYSKTRNFTDPNKFKPRTGTSLPISIQISWVANL